MVRGGRVAVLGVFVADATFRAARLPRLGETLLAEGFTLGPGGKGSNQAVAAARLGASVRLVTKLGDDAFADLGERTWRAAGIAAVAPRDPTLATGCAFIHVDDASGDNAIVIAPGAAATLSPADVDAAGDAIADAEVFLTQLEQPLAAAVRGLERARAAGAVTILNPAPAAALADDVLALVDVVTPNAGEAATLTGIAIAGPADAERAGAALLARGARLAVITLGADGAVLVDGDRTVHVPAVAAGPVVETTGAGDAFNGGLAAALARGDEALTAVRVAARVAGVAVTRPGTAAAMPFAAEVVGFSS